MFVNVCGTLRQPDCACLQKTSKFVCCLHTEPYECDGIDKVVPINALAHYYLPALLMKMT